MENEAIVAFLVFGFLIFIARWRLYTSGDGNNTVHWILLFSGIIVFGTGLTFALPVWFPDVFNFTS